MRESSVLLLGFISEISFFGHLLCENETRLATLTTSSQVLKQHLGYSIIVLVTNCSQKPNYRNFSDVPDQRSTFLKGFFFQKVQWLFDLYFPQIFENHNLQKKSLLLHFFAFRWTWVIGKNLNQNQFNWSKWKVGNISVNPKKKNNTLIDLINHFAVFNMAVWNHLNFHLILNCGWFAW